MSTIIDGSTGVIAPSGGTVNPSTDVSGINYSCRAWVSFNGTGTVAIRASGNVTSITDVGTGKYTVNFTTAMSDANYSITGMNNFVLSNTGTIANRTTTAYTVWSYNSSSVFADYDDINVAVFR